MTNQINSASTTGETVVLKTADELREVTRKILMKAGADQRNADQVAEILVSSHLCGVDTHGVFHLPRYVAMIEAGELVPTAWPEILSQTPTTALVSGNWTFGHVTAKYAMEVAIAKAEKQNVAVVGIVRSNHIGRLGEYVELAASKGMISMVLAGGFGVEAPTAVPYGGRKRVLHTNPIAMGFPVGSESPMMFDFATTAVSGVKVVQARDNNTPLPPGCIVDKDGNPTTDAAAFFEGGAYLPFGGHKGYALMLAAEFLGRIFTGSDKFVEGRRGGPILRHTGTVFIVFRSDLFRPVAEYSAAAEEMCRRIRAVPPAPGFREVLVPGDPEARSRAIRERDGIAIAQELWRKISDLAKALDVDIGCPCEEAAGE
jgi:LDH2 family malate/lactate/ureidoglycolate dehydrogenase